MRIITIQHESVLVQLMKEGIYFNNSFDINENLKEPYKFMTKEPNRIIKECLSFD